jgi:hypothetical protein
MSEEYRFDPDALRKKLSEESGIALQPQADPDAKEEDAPKAPTHDEIFEGFAKAALDNPKPKSDTNLLPYVGGVLGGMAQYKGLGTGLFNPNPELFAPAQIAQPVTTPASTITPLSDVEHTMQSGQGTRPGETGRQRESAHNWETNRQKLAQESTLNQPGAKRVIVETGPLYQTASGVAIPQHEAVRMEEELRQRQAAQEQERQRLAMHESEAERQRLARANRNASIAGYGRGVGRVAQGIAGGAIAAPQLYEYAKDYANHKPTDETQLMSGLGGLMMALGKNKLGALGGLAQLPYAIKHRKELMDNLLLSDVVPDTVRMGMTGAELTEPANPRSTSRNSSGGLP